MRRFFAFICLCMAAFPAPARAAGVDLGGDYYEAGYRAEVAKAGIGNAFVAARRIEFESDISGALHAASETLRVTGDIGENLVAAAREIRIESHVGGSALALASDVFVDGDVSERLRVASDNLRIDGAAGSLSASVETLTLNGEILGNAWIEADSVNFGDGARIRGRLFVAAPGEISIPSSVISGSRVEFVDPRDMDGELGHGGHGEDGFGGYILGFAASAAIVFLMSLAFHDKLSSAAELFVSRPFKAAWAGILGLSALLGLSLLSLLTVAGAVLTVLGFLAMALLLAVGSLIFAYMLGFLLLDRFPRPLEHRQLASAVIAIVGVALTALLWSVPYVGYYLGFLASVMGLGALDRRLKTPDIWRWSPRRSLF